MTKQGGKNSLQNTISSTKNVVKATKGKGKQNDGTLFGALNTFLDRRLDMIFWIFFSITLLFCILLFDIRFSIAGDDSAYVIRASDFIHHFTFPGFRGPLYPIVLSPVVWLFGVSSIPLKSLSIVFLLGSFFFTYKAFKNRIPSVLLVSVLILVSINSSIIYYASQTYSETFFMFIQALTFYVLFKYILDQKEGRLNSREIRHYLILGFCILCLGLTRSVGFSALAAIPVYFVLKGEWKKFILVTATTLLLIALFQGLKYLLWGSAEFTLSNEVSSMFDKNYYKPVMGKEDFHGFLMRIVINSNSYISKHFYAMLGIRDVSCNPLPWLNIATWVIFFTGIGFFFKKNKYLLSTALYTFILLIASFLLLQSNWNQSRLIVPFMTFILLILLSTFYFLLMLPKLKKLQWIFPIGIVVLTGLSYAVTSDALSQVRKIDGIYSGLTPDMENYVRMSKWASDNLPKDAVVACRKPSISFIYGSKVQFFGIIKIPNYSVTNLFNDWKIKKSKYVMIKSADLAHKKESLSLFRAFKNGLVAYIISPEQKSYIIEIPDSIRDRTCSELAKLKIRWRTNPDSLRSEYKDMNGYYVIYPDSLLNILKKAKVTHIMTANLRANPKEKTKLTIATVENFVGMITDKYTFCMKKIAQVGSDENEPSAIFLVDYSQCKPVK